MILSANIFGYKIKFVFRHMWEKCDDVFSDMFMWKTKEIGLWYKTYKTVSKPKKGPAIIGKGGTHSTSYMFGVNLIVAKFWFDVCYRPLELKIN